MPLPQQDIRLTTRAYRETLDFYPRIIKMAHHLGSVRDTMIDYDKPVRVFLNPRHGCYNIMQNGRVKATAKQIRLRDAEFTVRESGRQRMLREQRRTIHAWVAGELIDYLHPNDSHELEPLSGRSATYNPYRYSSFVDRENQTPLHRAALVQFDDRGVTYR